LKLGRGGAKTFADVTFDCFSEGGALGEGGESEGDLAIDEAVAVAVRGAKEGVNPSSGLRTGCLPQLGNGGDDEGGAPFEGLRMSGTRE
jgi:hypothetical protein